MKKGVLVALISLFCLAATAAQWTMTITSSTRCIPGADVGPSDATAWTNGITVSAGGYYTPGVRVYMPITSGTSTNQPTHIDGIATGADGIGWLRCGSDVGRQGVIACVLTGNEVHYNRNGAATTNMPWTVKNIFDPARGDWRFIPADGGTSTVSFLEL